MEWHADFKSRGLVAVSKSNESDYTVVNRSNINICSCGVVQARHPIRHGATTHST